MYFFVLIFLLLIVPTKIERKCLSIIYLKIFLCSTLYFYLITDKNLLLLSIINYICIIVLIYRLFNNTTSKNEDSNMLFHLAHEVKNPIAVCKGYLDMLDVNNKEKVEKYIPIIKSEMSRALTIMDEFLSLKRIKLNKELMDITLLIEDVKETTSLVLNDNKINFNVINSNQELIINGDYDKLKQVIMNLLKNSYEAEAKNIKLIVEVNKDLIIKIVDDGIGISKQDVNKIGNLFYTTKACGTGIGVSLSKEIINLHNGKLDYESTLNKGTTATIILPIKYIF